jgi:cytochrome P450
LTDKCIAETLRLYPPVWAMIISLCYITLTWNGILIALSTCG